MRVLNLFLKIEGKTILAAIDFFMVLANIVKKARNEQYTPFPEFETLLVNFNKEDNFSPAILYFGDSVLLRISREDVQKDTLDQMLANKVKNKYSILSIAHTAYHMLVYRGFIRILQSTLFRPKIVILPINLRSFSPQWDFNPAWQFQNEIQTLESYRTTASTKVVPSDKLRSDSWLYKLYDLILINYPIVGCKFIGYFRKIIRSVPENESQYRSRLMNIFIFHYFFPLAENHLKLIALGESLKLLRDLKVAVVAYVTPINWQAGVKYVGNDFIEMIKMNINVVSDTVFSYYGKDNIKFADLSMILDSSSFFSEDNATEHLNQEGREILSSRIENIILGIEDIQDTRTV
ncbi:MAG: hypothetical protein H6634_08600 [Anaerolineales bacterium]|nr:hypothetical protein [Anaerolineales bacterium]